MGYSPTAWGRGHSERGFHRNGISLPPCVLFAIWGVCPQMAISDTCRHVPDTFLHVPCPCLQFRNLPPLPASLYPPFLGAHARALQSCKGKAPHSLSRMPFGAFVLKWRFLIRADTCRTRSYTCRAQCLQFRNLPPLPASLYPPLHKEGTPSDEGHKNKREEFPQKRLVGLGRC